MAINESELKGKLEQYFPDAEIVIRDLAGDGDHYALEITSSDFAGKSRINQHKLVNKALEGCLGTSLHALAIKTIAKN